MPKISAVIIAGNEEANIAEAITSVDFADEVLVVDSESTDKTCEIAESFKARVIVRPWAGFSPQKQFGVDHAENDWILSLDADERISQELRRELVELAVTHPPAHGYRIPRLSYYMGRAIRHSGWYPDRQLRFFHRTKGRWSNSLIHESVKMENGARVDDLHGELIHHTVNDALHHHRMIGERYAPLAARQMFEQGKTTSIPRVATAGLVAFISSYILKAGFLDGLAGFCIARFAGHHAFLKHLRLWELQNGK